MIYLTTDHSSLYFQTYRVPFFEKELCQIRSILACNTSDECNLSIRRHLDPLYLIFELCVFLFMRSSVPKVWWKIFEYWSCETFISLLMLLGRKNDGQWLWILFLCLHNDWEEIVTDNVSLGRYNCLCHDLHVMFHWSFVLVTFNVLINTFLSVSFHFHW